MRACVRVCALDPFNDNLPLGFRYFVCGKLGAKGNFPEQLGNDFSGVHNKFKGTKVLTSETQYI